MKWFHKKTIKNKNIGYLTKTYNEKYGDYDYKDDSRSMDVSFESILIKSVGDLGKSNVLVCGSNSGYEILILSKLYPNSVFTALDVSTKALKKLQKRLPKVRCIHADMENISIPDNSFDVYINCRSIHSTNVDIESALNEAIRITKGKIIISVSNGYLIDGKLINGMFDYDSCLIDSKKPLLIKKMIKKIFRLNNYFVKELGSLAEFFIIAVK